MKKFTSGVIEDNITRAVEEWADPRGNDSEYRGNAAGTGGNMSIFRGNKGVDSEGTGEDASWEGEYDGKEFSSLSSAIDK